LITINKSSGDKEVKYFIKTFSLVPNFASPASYNSLAMAAYFSASGEVLVSLLASNNVRQFFYNLRKFHL